MLQLKDASKGADLNQKTLEAISQFKGVELKVDELEQAKPKDQKRFDQVSTAVTKQLVC